MTLPSLPQPTPAGSPPTAGPVEPEFQPPLVQPVRATPPKRSSTGGFLLTIAAVIAVGGLAFAVGRVTAPASASSAAAASGFGQGGFGQGGFGQGGFGGPNGSFAPGAGGADGAFARRALATEATVTAVAPDHLTIQIGTSGQTIDVKTNSSTTYHTQQAASASAVAAGSKVLLQFNPATSAAAGTGGTGGSNPAPAASGVPGTGFLRGFGTVKDVTVLAP